MWSKGQGHSKGIQLPEATVTGLGGGRGANPRKRDLELRTNRQFLPGNMKSAVVPSRTSILIICILITGLGIISIISHLTKRRRSQRNRRGK